MSFDKPTRNLLAKIVAQCRDLLADDIADQLQSAYGLYPDGTTLDVARTEDGRRAAEDLRALWAHFEAAEAGSAKARRTAAYQQLVREIGFTLLNRLAALRLCEERGLVVECVRRGMVSDGFQLYDQIADGALGNRYQTYRAFLESLFDELALDLGVLFDRGIPQSLVFPSEAALSDVLTWLNGPELAARHVWQQDETIGWIYQYYNDPAERKAMRQDSSAPRNSRELAVRNQFFTPRYVVEFLTDNTLGRIWYEMRQADTHLADQCRYLVHRPKEIFLQRGEDAPPGEEDTAQLSQEELLKQPVYIPYRPTKDPRDLKILDPACGSGHFLLYAFDLLVTIYEEAWADPDLPPFSETGTWLVHDYPDLEELRAAVPGLILRHNLHGIDIDARAVQIAALALWLRAQRAYQDLGLPPADRSRITKTHIVTAEPMPGDRGLLDEFVSDLRPKVLGDLVRVVFEKMKLAGEAGSLLKIEEELSEAIAEARRQWAGEPQAEQLALFPEARRPQPRQLPLFDVSGITDEAFWETAEERVLEALRAYATRVENGRGTRRRLFAEDVAQGFAFVDLCRKRYDVALMNPPYGDPSYKIKKLLQATYNGQPNDLYSCFLERTLAGLSKGLIGALTSRTFLNYSSFSRLREKFIFARSHVDAVLDLGFGVLDNALVETCATVLRLSTTFEGRAHFFRLLDTDEKSVALKNLIDSVLQGKRELNDFEVDQRVFEVIEGKPMPYWAGRSVLSRLLNWSSVYEAAADIRLGVVTGNNERFLRLRWEVTPHLIDPSLAWASYSKGGDYSKYYSDIHLLIDWRGTGEHIRQTFEDAVRLREIEQYLKPGLTYPLVTVKGINVRTLPADCVFDNGSPSVFPHPQQDPMLVLGLLNSRIAELYVRCFTSSRHWQVGYMRRLPWPKSIENHDKEDILRSTRLALDLARSIVGFMEPSAEYLLPALLWPQDVLTLSQASSEALDFLEDLRQGFRQADHQCNVVASEIYKFTTNEGKILEREVPPIDTNRDQFPDSLWNETTFVEDTVSYSVGCFFGRWDIRIALDPTLAPKRSGPFDPLPVCPPGMLIAPDGLPATPGHIVSEAWLQARSAAITLPPEGSFEGPATIPDDEYPIRIAWDGILVDDPGLDGDNPHPSDIVRRAREVLAMLWTDNHDAVEAEACEILRVRELRDYFRKPAKFFADHLKRYSKSRRKAPIYWPLSTASGSYTLWLYYHRLDDEILYTAVNRYVTPKIEQVKGYVARLEADLSQATGRTASQVRDQLDDVRAFLAELREFRQELLRIAGLPYKPNLNDGVIINAAPLHKLFHLSRWAKDTEKVWKKLDAGEYDWAHMAYTLWPDRVREVCKRDRSIAIAHGLEELCEVPEKRVKR